MLLLRGFGVSVIGELMVDEFSPRSLAGESTGSIAEPEQAD
ncbi:hypothetical protein [Mycobacterium szulgai]|nr:hypothetical protein [Mycobacterium szulgai]